MAYQLIESRINNSGISDIFFQDWWAEVTHEANKRWVIFWNDGPKHIKLATVDIWVVYFTYIVYFTYTLTQTLVCIYTCPKQPLKKEEQLSLNSGQKRGAFCNTFDLN